MNARAEWVAFLLIVITVCFTIGYATARSSNVCLPPYATNPFSFLVHGE